MLLASRPAADRRADIHPTRVCRSSKPECSARRRWDQLANLLDEAQHAHYDFATATTLIEACQELKRPKGKVTRLISETSTGSKLSARLQESRNIGSVPGVDHHPGVARVWHSCPAVASALLLGAIPIVTCERQTTVPEGWLSEQGLVEVQTTAAESMGSACHVDSPYAIRGVAGDTSGFISM